MKKEVFKIHVQNLAIGWCRVLMLINDKSVWFNAEYMGPNPLASFIDACAYLMHEGGEYNIKWYDKFIVLKIVLTLDHCNMLHLDIIEQEDESFDKHENTIYGEWHEVIPFNDFVSAIIAEGFRVLNAFGLYGYRCSWQNHEDFPLTNLLHISGKYKEIWKGDSCCTDLSKEIECLQDHLTTLEITKEKKIDECTIYYESWQLQCCGKPFSVDDKVSWTCMLPHEYKNAHGINLDFEEDHHGFATHSIKGTVSKILSERSEYPKGKEEVWYQRAKTIQEEINYADGKVTDANDDKTTETTLWGYIVYLKDAVVKPIKENKKD